MGSHSLSYSVSYHVSSWGTGSPQPPAPAMLSIPTEGKSSRPCVKESGLVPCPTDLPCLAPGGTFHSSKRAAFLAVTEYLFVAFSLTFACVSASLSLWRSSQPNLHPPLVGDIIVSDRQGVRDGVGGQGQSTAGASGRNTLCCLSFNVGDTSLVPNR